MAIGVIKFTYKQRLLLKSVLCFLCILEICLALTIDTVAAYIYFVITPELYKEKSEVGFVFVAIMLYSLQVVFHFALGLTVNCKCLRQADKKSTRSLLLFWICAGVYFIANLLILAAMSKKVGYHISHSLANSFRFGMENYLKDGKWKNFIDRLQYRLACCGIDGYENWHEISWLTKYHVNENSDKAKKFIGDETRTYKVNPWSCCRSDFPLQCLHDPLQQQTSTQVWDNEPKIVVDSINTRGCLPLAQKPIIMALTLFVSVTVVIFAIDLIIILLARWLYISSRNALILSDPRGVAPGWIFGKGDCGYKGGKSIYDIMNASKNGEKKSKKRNKDDVDRAKSGPETDRLLGSPDYQRLSAEIAKVHNHFAAERSPSIEEDNLNYCLCEASFEPTYSDERHYKRQPRQREEDTTTNYEY